MFPSTILLLSLPLFLALARLTGKLHVYRENFVGKYLFTQLRVKVLHLGRNLYNSHIRRIFRKHLDMYNRENIV